MKWEGKTDPDDKSGTLTLPCGDTVELKSFSDAQLIMTEIEIHKRHAAKEACDKLKDRIRAALCQIDY